MDAEMLRIGSPSARIVGTLGLEHLLTTPRFVVPASTGLNALVDLQKIRAETVNRVKGKEIAPDQQNSCGNEHQHGFGRKYREVFQNAFKGHRGSWLRQ
jgi:hypothetical protein